MTQLEADDLVVLTITPPIHSLCKHNHSLTPHSTNNSIINKTPLNKTTCIINLHRPAMIHKLMATGLIRCMHISHSTQTQLLFFQSRITCNKAMIFCKYLLINVVLLRLKCCLLTSFLLDKRFLQDKCLRTGRQEFWSLK